MKKILLILAILTTINGFSGGTFKTTTNPDFGVTFTMENVHSNGNIIIPYSQLDGAKVWIYSPSAGSWQNIYQGNLTHSLNVSDMYLDYNSSTVNWNGYQVLKVRVIFYKCIAGACGNFNNYWDSETCEMWIIGNKSLEPDPATGYCSESIYDLSINDNGITSHKPGATYSIAQAPTNGSATINNNTISFSGVTANTTISITYNEFISNIDLPGDIEKTFTKDILVTPIMGWLGGTSSLPNSLFTSDPVVSLNNRITTTPSFLNLDITVGGYGSNGYVGIPGGFQPYGDPDCYFDPSLSGYGTYLIAYTAENTIPGLTTTCISHLYDTITVINDPGIPESPEGFNTDAQMLDSLTSITPCSGLFCFKTYSSFHWCDGDQVDLEIINDQNGGSAYPSGIDSVIYEYHSNGSVDHIGIFGIYDIVPYTIPTTNSIRTDVIYARLKSTAGNIGAAYSQEVKVYYPTAANEILPDTICFSGDLELQMDYQTDNLHRDSLYFVAGGSINPMDTMINSLGVVYDTALFEQTRNYVWRNINGVLIDTGYYVNFGSVATKTKKVIREEFTWMPRNYPTQFGIKNLRTCVLKDTITYVQKPVVSMIIPGDTNADPGDLYVFYSNNTDHDYTTWNFNDGSGIHTGDTMYHYMNDMGYYDVVCTAWDNYGCWSDTAAYAVIEVGNWLGLDDVNIESIEMYPSPFTSDIYLTLSTGINDPINVTIYTTSGSVVYNNQFNSRQIHLENLNHLSKGMYIISVAQGGAVLTSKIVKQ